MRVLQTVLGKGPSIGVSTGKGNHNTLQGNQGNIQEYTRRITISPMETRILYKVFPMNKKAEALYVSPDKQLLHSAVGHET